MSSKTASLNKFQHTVRVGQRCMGAFGAFFIAVMGVYLFADVIGRYVFNRPIGLAYELSELVFMVCIVLSGIVLAEHIRVDIVVERLKGKARLALETFNFLLSVGYVGIMIWESGLMAAYSIGIRERANAAITFPLFPSRIVVVVCLTCLIVVMITCFVRYARSGNFDHGVGTNF